MKTKRIWLLVGGILLTGGAFLLLNFRLAASDTQAMLEINSTKIDGHYPERLGPDDKISFILTGEGPLASGLQNALLEEMDKAGVGKLELSHKLEPGHSNPALVVKVGRPGLVWTPFFATSRFSIQAGYATDGDMTFMETLDKTQPYIRSRDPSVVDLYTEYDVSDRSFGLISRPGYQRYVADYLAGEIVNTLKNLYNIQDLGG